MKKTFGKFDFMQFAGNVAGAIAAKVVVSKLPIQNNYIKSAAPIVLGAFLMSNKNKMIAAAGTGMVAVGGAQLVSTFVPGISGMLGLEDNSFLGAPAGNVLEGFDDISGMDDINGIRSHYMHGAAGNVLDGTDEYIAGDTDYMA
jgi:hypothetical protein